MNKTRYIGHVKRGPRDFTKPNFSLGSRDMTKALINASLENQAGIVSNTHRARLPAIELFITFVKTDTDIKRLNDIGKSNVMHFGESLKNSVDEELLAPATARDYLSHVNRALAQARGDEACVVNATRELGMKPKSGIATVDRSIDAEMHDRVLDQVTPEVGFVMQLQRTFGMRFREASLFDATRALKELKQGQAPNLWRGTKGGQSRALPVDTEEKHRLLARVAGYQQAQQRDTLVPSHLSFKAFQSEAWRQTKRADRRYLSHGERKHFACEYYAKAMGVRCPVQAQVAHGKAHHQYIANALNLTVQEAKRRDHQVRLALSTLLGHHRISVTHAYLG
ncbi:integrase domain-containing protein [Vibrio sp. PNB22_1_1]|uniref:integrase domain-containing protein n=1 Tax=unclassified Vibrio TaxID=2614977 RepID=UPI00406A4D17